MCRASYPAFAAFASVHPIVSRIAVALCVAVIGTLAGCGTPTSSSGTIVYGGGLPTTYRADGQGGGWRWQPDTSDLPDGGTPTDADAGGPDTAATDTVGPTSDVVGGDDGGDDGGDVDTGPPLSMVDADLDGFSPSDGDCDDQDKDVYPGSPEVCDGKDNNCNNLTDEIDVDHDGFFACPGAGQDCDDGDAKIFPGAPVDCSNGKDNNCDGKVDNSVSGDADQDGFDACQDCNDNDPTVYPGAPQSCDGAKDANCDGQLDAALDADQDGHPACTDCDDSDPNTYPLAPEVCNGKDNDCTGVADDLDLDGDGYSGCGPDCDDTDLNINPGAGRDCKNGKDNDCNGKIDANEDGDGDGFVGCNDCDDADPAQNPNAWEFAADLIDNDCDGLTDEAPVSCDVGALSDSNPNHYVTAVDLCPPAGSTVVQSSAFPTQASAQARGIRTVYGPKNTPRAGQHMVAISTGVAAAVGQPGYKVPQNGTQFTNSAPYPPVNCKKSGSVYDYTEWKLTLKVPGNVNGFSFDFNFMSAEYPEWVGTQFNDKFVAVLDSKKFKGNVSFDSKGNCISINNAFFTVCKGCTQGDGDLQGTGYEGGIGGGTGWLTTTSPVEPGETITLRFIVFDEGDHIYDSVVLLDNFRWEVLGSGGGGPSTVRPGG
ncbi:MAG: hypothetical protein RIT45_1007 [Pseudomonadota bacterium]